MVRKKAKISLLLFSLIWSIAYYLLYQGLLSYMIHENKAKIVGGWKQVKFKYMGHCQNICSNASYAMFYPKFLHSKT